MTGKGEQINFFCATMMPHFTHNDTKQKGFHILETTKGMVNSGKQGTAFFRGGFVASRAFILCLFILVSVAHRSRLAAWACFITAKGIKRFATYLFRGYAQELCMYVLHNRSFSVWHGTKQGGKLLL